MSKILKIAVFVALILGIITFFPKSQAATTSTLKFNAKKHTLYTPQVKTIANILTLAGSIGTDQLSNLRFQNSGKLVWVGVKVGDRVRRGQAIASLDKWELRKNLQTQFNKYRTELSNFDDVQDTYRETRDRLLLTDTVRRILTRTQNSLDNAVINYEITDMAIKEATIYSPIDGIVIALDQPLAGTNITPATANFTIVNPNALYFKSEIDQEAVTSVQVGHIATLKLDSFPDSDIDSKVTYIAFTPVSGQTSTVYEIRFELPVDNQDLTYRLGMDGDVDLTLQKSDRALVIPLDALFDDGDQKFVYVIVDKELVRRDVTTGIETDNDVEILEGITVNDQVAVIQK